MCPPGHIARIKTPKKSGVVGVLKTLMPFCRSCNVGEYQPEYDQTECNKCPGNMTSDRGSKSIDECFEKFEKSCNELTCGINGRCIASGAFYTCECQNGFYGQKCELKHDSCSVTPCFNGGACSVVNETAICQCPPEFIGEFCEVLNDPCNQKNCLNGANCYEINDQAVCDCLPGFDGEFCERQIAQDFCESSPCASGATCINSADDYECKCEAGKIGKRCHLTACDYKPCPENSICVNYNYEKATIDSYL